MSDLELVRKMVQALAAKAGLLSGRVMTMVTGQHWHHLRLGGRGRDPEGH